jgi:AraC-like DNA-binding protein
MLKDKPNRFAAASRPSGDVTPQREQLDALCRWIELHLNEPIGWQELMAQTGWDYQTIQTLFYRYKCTTAMTWIRLRRQMQTSGADMPPKLVPPRQVEPLREPFRP